MKYTLVRGDDWEGLYIGNDLYAQDHSITIKEFAEHAINIPITAFEKKWVDLDWMEGRGDFPDVLNEVEFEK